MSSSHSANTLPLTCSICGEHSQSFTYLHQHHLSCHTAEELSLVIISFKESELTMAGIENEHVLFTQLCKIQKQCDVTAVLSKNTEATADLEVDLGLNKEAEKEGTEDNLNDINSDVRNLEVCCKSNTETNKLNYISSRSRCLCNTEFQELAMPVCCNTEKENMLPLNLNETNRDDIKSAETEMVYVDTSSSNTYKKHKKVKKAAPVTQITMCNTSILQSEVSHYVEDSGGVILDMECVDDFDRSSIEKILEDASSSSVAENSSTDSEFHMFALDKLSQSEICIQAIVTRLSNIAKAVSEPLQENDSKCKQEVLKTYKEDYILPSPLRKYHHSKISYDFGSLDDNERCIEDSIDDCFRPSIKLNDFKDAVCETIATDFSEKEVQVDNISLANLQDSNVHAALKEQHEKYTQTGIISLTTRRLAAYRKPFRSSPLTDNNYSRPSNNDSALVSNLNVKPSEKRPQIYPGMTNDRRFFCELCGKGYKKKSHLERHVRVHTGERPFPCPYCDKRFAVRSILKQHVRTHTGEKPYCCSLCLQRFPQKSGLMTHTMLHTGKPFKCDKCEKAFVSNHKLLQHLSSHGNKSSCKYTCSVCKTEFLTKGAMLQHRHIHSSKSLFLSHNFSNTLFFK